MSEDKGRQVVIDELVFLQLMEGLKVWQALNGYVANLEEENPADLNAEAVLTDLKEILKIVTMEGTKNE